MLKTVRKTIEKYAMLKAGDHVLVAVSGGPDSVALLHTLVVLLPSYRLHLTVAHLNHGIRGAEAEREGAFVRRLCSKLGIACVCRTVDIPSLQKERGKSLEEVAREERYRFFDETACSCGAEKIATGHHRDDQAETVLINLIRGSGLEGMKGIVPIRDERIIRPLIDVGRSEIISFLEREGLAYMTDSSNLAPFFLRNRIRMDLIPELTASYNPQIVQGLCKTAEIMRRDDDYLRNVVRQILHLWKIVPGTGETSVPLTAFRGLHEALQGRIIKLLTEGSAGAKTGVGHRHVAAVLNLVKNPRRVATLDLPCWIRIEKREDTLLIRKDVSRKRRADKQESKTLPPGFEYMVKVPGSVHMTGLGMTIRFEFIEKPALSEMKIRPQTAFMDYDRIRPPLILRNMKPGDKMVFMGMGGMKKLKAFFIDRKIPRTLRSKIPLLVDTQSVIWIAGERISERVRVNGWTKKVLKAEMI